MKYHEDFEKTKGRGFTPVVDDPVTERVRRNTQVVSDAAYKGVHPHIVEMDRRPGIIVGKLTGLLGRSAQSKRSLFLLMEFTSLFIRPLLKCMTWCPGESGQKAKCCCLHHVGGNSWPLPGGVANSFCSWTFSVFNNLLVLSVPTCYAKRQPKYQT